MLNIEGYKKFVRKCRKQATYNRKCLIKYSLTIYFSFNVITTTDLTPEHQQRTPDDQRLQ
jgi:hypothetical protein